MSTKGRNQFSNHHPNRGQREAAARDVARAKGEVHIQHSGEHMTGAPHFPPNENLPPQAKRLAMKKKRQSEKRDRRAEDQARAHGAGMQATSGLQGHEDQIPRGRYPDALPERGATQPGLMDRAQPVIRDAQGHWSGLVDAAGKFLNESMGLLRTPGVLMRALLRPRHA